MDPEMRKSYNSLYYKRNKDKILEKLTSKVNCEFCNRKIYFANLNKHYSPMLSLSSRQSIIKLFPKIKTSTNPLSINPNFYYKDKKVIFRWQLHLLNIIQMHINIKITLPIISNRISKESNYK